MTKANRHNPAPSSRDAGPAVRDDTEVRTGSSSDVSAADVCLSVSSGGPIELYDLPELGEVTIGRSSSCHVRIEGRSVSRVHAILRSGDGFYIKDNHSANGTRVNQMRIPAGEWVRVNVGAVLSVGSALIVVQPKRRMTGQRRVLSHDHFEAHVEEECARCARSGSVFSILRFRTPRELSGTRVEGACAAALRASDILARCAPHEYELLLVGLDERRAATAANRLMDEISDRIPCPREQIRFAISSYPRSASSPQELLQLATRALAGLDEGGPSLDALAGSNQGLRGQIARVAHSSLSVLLIGETGVGKEVFARLLHERSPRADKKMLRLNCAALTETLLESELFGFEKGAFTGADRAKPGLLETATGGTVLLDEVGEMPLSTQVKLLRVLEEREVQRIGALEPRPIDVRFLAATNRDLEAAVAAGRFRQDLLFRINAVTLRIPPLRERKDEIEPLARHFAARAAEGLGNSTPVITERALEALRCYAWPGNVRELRNVMERAVVLAEGASIDTEHLPVGKLRATALAGMARGATEDRPADGDLLQEEGRQRTHPPPGTALAPQEAAEKARILAALEECAGNQTHAARLLGMSRGTLISRLERYGIPRPRKKAR